MAELQIARAWEEDGKVCVHAYEVVAHRGEQVTLQYHAEVERAGKKPAQIEREVKEQLKAQREAAREKTPEHVDHTAKGGLFDTTEKGAFATRKLEV